MWRILHLLFPLKFAVVDGSYIISETFYVKVCAIDMAYLMSLFYHDMKHYNRKRIHSLMPEAGSP